MFFSYSPPNSAPIWMQFVPARENTALPAKEDCRATEGMVHTGMACKTIAVDAEQKQAEEEVSSVAENISENGVSAKGAGPHISSVDQESQLRGSQLRGSQLAKREYQRDSIRVGKGRAMLSSLVRRLNTAETAAQEKNIERAVQKMCGPNLGQSSDANKEIAETRGRCTDETAVDASVNVDPVGSQSKSSRVASLPLRKNCRNHRLCCPKNYWLYCPSQVAGSDYLSLPQLMTRTRVRRPDRAASSQLSSNFHFDSD